MLVTVPWFSTIFLINSQRCRHFGLNESMPNQPVESSIYIKVKKIIADNLHIHEDSVYEGFQFNKFIDNLATYRIQRSGSHHLLYYLEAVNIYFDLSEEFKMEFPISLMDKNLMTVGDLVLHIESQLSSLV